MTKKQRSMLIRIIVSFVLYIPLGVAAHMGKLPPQLSGIGLLALYLIPYILIGLYIRLCAISGTVRCLMKISL